MNATARVFESKPAVREASGLLISLVGPSGGGKTFSAMRLATGIQRVVGGDIDVIDTENGRALHYADKFKYGHVRFEAPFGSLDYLAALRSSARRGVKTVVIDSMSHEHEGVGGMLDAHDAEVDRMAGPDYAKRERVKMLAWGKPKKARQTLINELLQLNVNLILCFRAKEKLKISKGKDPEQLGWMPISGPEFMYEMALQVLLKPGSNGVPTWEPEYPGEKAMIKLPAQFISLFKGDKQLDEATGEELAKWASGGVRTSPQIVKLIADYAKAESADEVEKLNEVRKTLWVKATPAADKERMAAAASAAKDRVTPAPATTAAPGPDSDTWVATLSGCQDMQQLKDAWAACMEAFDDIPPGACDAAYQVRKEEL